MSRKIELLLGAALAAGLVPGLAAGTPRTDVARLPAAADRFAPPAGPLVLTRELRRQMGTSGSFVSRRSYQISFRPKDDSWRVEGTLLSSEVEAPGVAPEFVELERARRDVGLFPLELDSHGMIVTQRATTDRVAEAKMQSVAASTLAHAGIAAPSREAALAMMASLVARASQNGGTWPADLFVSRAGERVETRSLPLGDGSAGKVTISIRAAEGSNGLVERFERRVVTETAGTSRQSTETWTIALAR